MAVEKKTLQYSSFYSISDLATVRICVRLYDLCSLFSLFIGNWMLRDDEIRLNCLNRDIVMERCILYEWLNYTTSIFSSIRVFTIYMYILYGCMFIYVYVSCACCIPKPDCNWRCRSANSTRLWMCQRIWAVVRSIELSECNKSK